MRSRAPRLGKRGGSGGGWIPSYWILGMAVSFLLAAGCGIKSPPRPPEVPPPVVEPVDPDAPPAPVPLDVEEPPAPPPDPPVFDEEPDIFEE